MTTRLTTGRVQALPSSGMVSVLLTGQTAPQSVPIGRAVTVAVGDTVLVAGDTALYVIAALGTGTSSTVAATAGTQAPPSGNPRQEAVTPIASGTYRSGWRTDTTDLYCGDWTGRGVNWGGAWYGTGFRGRGSFTAGKVGLLRLDGGAGSAQTPTMLLLPDSNRPATWSSPVATAAGPALSIGVSTDWDLPSTWRTALENGSAGGVGIGQAGASPYIHLAPPTIQATFT